MPHPPCLHILPLADQAALAYCRDEQAALLLAARVREKKPAWLVDVVQAYTSVAVFFDLGQVDFEGVRQALEELERTATAGATIEGKQHTLPCCYGLGLDLERVAEVTRRSVRDVVELHSSQVYTVYAIGFCPGFPYLGYLPEALCGVPRLPSPRLRVERGSVGLTGRQTGIYTEERPGGWNIVGRTPLELVSVVDGYFPLRTGDQVRFRPIDEQEFRELAGKRLE